MDKHGASSGHAHIHVMEAILLKNHFAKRIIFHIISQECLI